MLLGFFLRLDVATKAPVLPEEKEYCKVAEENLKGEKGFYPRVYRRDAEHPLLIAVLVRAGWACFGKNKLGSRLPFVITGVLTLLFLYLTAFAALNCQKTALLAAALLSVEQYHIAQSAVVDFEGPNLLLESVVLYLAVLFIRKRNTAFLFLMGGIIGLGFMVKETILLLWGCIIFAFLFIPELKGYLRRKSFFLSMLLSVAVIIPYYFYDYINYSPQASDHIERILPLGFSLRGIFFYLGEFFLGKAIIFNQYFSGIKDAFLLKLSAALWPVQGMDWRVALRGPVMAWPMGVVCLAGIFYAFRKRENRPLYFLVISAAFIFCVVSVLKGDELFDLFWWTDLALLPGVICAAHFLVQFSQRNNLSKYLVGTFVLLMLWKIYVFVFLTDNVFKNILWA